jgi:hypothetical protein
MSKLVIGSDGRADVTCGRPPDGWYLVYEDHDYLAAEPVHEVWARLLDLNGVGSEQTAARMWATRVAQQRNVPGRGVYPRDPRVVRVVSLP